MAGLGRLILLHQGFRLVHRLLRQFTQNGHRRACRVITGREAGLICARLGKRHPEDIDQTDQGRWNFAQGDPSILSIDPADPTNPMILETSPGKVKQKSPISRVFGKFHLYFSDQS